MDRLSGERFGRLVVIEPTGKRQNNHIVWRCQCDCGNEHFVVGSVLKSGLSRSCGCLRRERFYKHGGKGTRLYNIWKNLKKRCNNSNNPKFRRYGGRGIEVDARWSDFVVFRDWALVNGYSDDLTIDRIDNDKGYFPENCQWLSRDDHSKKSAVDVPRKGTGRQKI